MRRTMAALAAVTLAGCGGGGPKTAPTTAPPSSAATTSASPAESATPGRLAYGAPFYSDTFKDRSKGWPVQDSATVSYVQHTDYATPLYTITVKKAGLEAFPHPEFRGVSRSRLEDYAVTALLQTTLGIGHDDRFGVTCRDLDGKKYVFEVGYDTTGSGSMPWAILKDDGTKEVALARGETSSGGSAFSIRGACAGAGSGAAHLVLSVNDTEVGIVEDSDAPLTAGYGGVYLSSKAGHSTLNVLGFSARSVTSG